MRRALGSLLLMLAVLLVAATPCFGADQLVARDVSTEDFPFVSMDVVLPAALLTDSSKIQFSVTENGRKTSDVTAKQAAAGTRPIDVVLVIDTSGSMQGQALASAQEAARAFIGELKVGSRAALVSFASRPVILSRFTTNQGNLEEKIASLKAGGETALNDALAQAAEIAAAAGTHQASVVLLSDGGDTRSRTSLDSAVKAMKSRKVPVFVIGLPSAEADWNALQTIAAQTGGRVYNVRSLDKLVGYYEDLARELQTHWVVQYKSNQPSTKDLDIAVRATAGAATAVGAVLGANPVYTAEQPAGTGLAAVPAANLVAYGSAVTLAFVAVALLVVVVFMVIVRPKSRIDELDFYDQLKGIAGDLPDEESANPNSLRARALGAVEAVAGKRGITRMVYDSLERAGLPLRPNEYILAHFALVLVAGTLMQLLTGSLVYSLLGVVVATIMPILWVSHRVTKRRKDFEEQLPDVLTLIAGSLRAGWGMLQAVEMVTREMSPPVSDEFRRVETEVRLGIPLETSLSSMANRVDSEVLRWTVSAIAIQREVGGNLAEVLDIIAATIRDRAALKRQIQALTSEGRLSGVILMVLPFFEFAVLYVVNPQYMSLLFTSIPGLVLLSVGATLMVIGGIWLRNVMTVEV